MCTTWRAQHATSPPLSHPDWLHSPPLTATHTPQTAGGRDSRRGGAEAAVLHQDLPGARCARARRRASHQLTSTMYLVVTHEAVSCAEGRRLCLPLSCAGDGDCGGSPPGREGFRPRPRGAFSSPFPLPAHLSTHTPVARSDTTSASPHRRRRGRGRRRGRTSGPTSCRRRSSSSQSRTRSGAGAAAVEGGEGVTAALLFSAGRTFCAQNPHGRNACSSTTRKRPGPTQAPDRSLRARRVSVSVVYVSVAVSSAGRSRTTTRWTWSSRPRAAPYASGSRTCGRRRRSCWRRARGDAGRFPRGCRYVTFHRFLPFCVAVQRLRNLMVVS